MPYMNNTLLTILIITAGIAVVILLIWKNNRDKKRMNPDAPDAMKETGMNRQRRKDKL